MGWDDHDYRNVWRDWFNLNREGNEERVLVLFGGFAEEPLLWRTTWCVFGGGQ